MALGAMRGCTSLLKPENGGAEAHACLSLRGSGVTRLVPPGKAELSLLNHKAG